MLSTSNELYRSKNLQKNKSYAEAVAGEVVVIKPKKIQENKTTKEAVRKALNPTKLEIGFTEIKDIRDGGMLIKCKSKEDVEKIKSEAEKKLKKGYEIRIKEQKNPHIKIVGLEDDIDKEVLEECILKQNSFPNSENCFLKVKTVKRMKSKYMAIIECDPQLSELFLNEGKISIGWSICRVYEYVPVFRCYKCGDYDHKADLCKKEERCLKCASTVHKTEIKSDDKTLTDKHLGISYE
ncbi:hypothetical protein NQ318_021955 [Aromia moschata]|uniref:CCHC-type domain-containing protein n=1 Tax=Aromia moschata TaxID=1265417 RepID=A0AAV8XUJ5_9CUCU|nr:hypothetical protein NQ318_021955 [Aromia moschata]